jgi:hypothetical protein
LHSQTLNDHKEYMHELQRDAQACASPKQGCGSLEDKKPKQRALLLAQGPRAANVA